MILGFNLSKTDSQSYQFELVQPFTFQYIIFIFIFSHALEDELGVS